MKDPVHKRNVILSTCIWIVASCNYYLLYFQVKYLKGDIFSNMTAIGLSEMLSETICGITTQRIGTKRAYLTYFALMASGALLYLTLGYAYEPIIPYLFLFTAFGSSSACVVNWLTNPKLFPVVYTSSTLGIFSFFARLSNILSTQIAEMDQPFPMYVVICSALSACVISQLLVIEDRPTR